MSSFLRVNNFVDAANQGSLSPSKKCLTAHSGDLSVGLADITWSTSAADRARNKATWQIFKSSLIGTVGATKFDWICQRYRTHINFARMEKSGKPLLPEHVELPALF
ncbi:MAG: hypothetical protein HYX67_08845 [Candidatus Melainabacteria bacterium]|nr:hypothetical protein [Candidatus Melainabacteria bacterium]